MKSKIRLALLTSIYHDLVSKEQTQIGGSAPTLQTLLASFFFNNPPCFMASLIRPSFNARYGFGLICNILQSCTSSSLSSCRSGALVRSSSNFHGVVPLSGCTTYRTLGFCGGADKGSSPDSANILSKSLSTTGLVSVNCGTVFGRFWKRRCSSGAVNLD